MEKFEVGEWGEWISQSGGYTKVKRLECIAVVPAGTPGFKILSHPGWEKFYILMFDGLGRDHESYLFATKPSKSGLRKVYWPRVKWLKKIAPPDS